MSAISSCPICIAEKMVELQIFTGPATIDERGTISQPVNFERIPFSLWFTLTDTKKSQVLRCYCPQCGLVFHHPDVFAPK